MGSAKPACREGRVGATDSHGLQLVGPRRGGTTSGWTPGGGTAVVNVAAQDVRTRLQSQAAALRQFTDEFLATRAAIRVSIPILFFLDLDFSRGGASAHPLGVVPEFRASY